MSSVATGESPPPRVAFELAVDASCSPSTSTSPSSPRSLSTKEGGVPYRPVPLSTHRLVGIVLGLGLFTIVYLLYAQHHAILFYTMTALVALFVVFIYTYGVVAILIMIRMEYAREEKERGGATPSTIHITGEEGYAEHKF